MIEHAIVSGLIDDRWRSPLQIRFLVKYVGETHYLTEILRALAREGLIDRLIRPADYVTLEFYRGNYPNQRGKVDT